jgi:DNA-binding MarR family transcriptional regulator
MLTTLYKVAHELDKKGEYGMADKIDAVVKELTERVGLKLADVVSLADELDKAGDVALADKLDAIVKEAAEKQKRPRPPKAWFLKMEKEIKKGNPEYNKKKVKETIGALWFDKLSDKEVEKLLKKYKKKK